MNSTNAADVVPVAEGLTELWLIPRRTYLHKREPRIAYVRDLRKKIANFIAKPFFMLIAGAFADIEDGAPLNVVLQPWYAAIGFIRGKAAEREAAKGTPWVQRFNAAQLRETSAEGKLNQAQLRVAANINDLAALHALTVAMREYDAVHDELQTLIAERFAAESLVA